MAKFIKNSQHKSFLGKVYVYVVRLLDRIVEKKVFALKGAIL